MASLIGVVGGSGTGKSTALGNHPTLGIKGLKPSETAIINVMSKPLPFKGWKQNYSGDVRSGGNYFAGTNSIDIINAIKFIDTSRPDIKNIVIDDMQYIMADQFMAKALVKGYEKFNKIGKDMYDVLNVSRQSRDDLTVFCLTHSESGEDGLKIKTIGKMLDDKITLEGLFTVVLYTHTEVDSSSKKVRYCFVTNNDGIRPAKSPCGMFDDCYIINDLGYVRDKVDEYNVGEFEAMPDIANTRPVMEVFCEAKGLDPSVLTKALMAIKDEQGNTPLPSGDLSTARPEIIEWLTTGDTSKAIIEQYKASAVDPVFEKVDDGDVPF